MDVGTMLYVNWQSIRQVIIRLLARCGINPSKLREKINCKWGGLNLTRNSKKASPSGLIDGVIRGDLVISKNFLRDNGIKGLGVIWQTFGCVNWAIFIEKLCDEQIEVIFGVVRGTIEGLLKEVVS